MMQVTHVVGASLIAIIVDRLVIGRQVGKTPLSATMGVLSRTAANAGIVFVMLTFSAAGAWALTASLPHSPGAVYLYSLFFVAMVLALALGGEILLSRWVSFVFLNRIFTRAATICSILGLLTLAPAADDLLRENNAFLRGIGGGAAAGAVFCCLELFWNGIDEKIDFLSMKNTAVSLARMLIAAGLLSMVLSGIFSTPRF